MLTLPQTGPSSPPGLTPEGINTEEEGVQGYGHRLQEYISKLAMAQMPLATIRTGKQREAETAGKFLEDISEVVLVRAFSGWWAVLGGCADWQGLSKLQGPH